MIPMVALATTAVRVDRLHGRPRRLPVYAALNQRAARKELGSEIELAPNRKPYYNDEELEGKRLELVQLVGVLLLVVIVIALPLYWVLEPTRQAGAKEQAADTLAGWGEDLFRPTAEGGFNCAGCHGGMNATGGNAPGTVTDPATGEVRAVTFIAPALNTVLYRFSPDEVRYILTYGRPGTPMSAWGLDGGGPMNAQQIDTPDRLSRNHPGAPRGLPDRGGRQPELPDRPPAERASAGDRDARPTRRRRAARPPATAKRCSTSPSPAGRTAAPAATRWGGTTASPASAARVASAGTSPAGPRTATSRRNRT